MGRPVAELQRGISSLEFTRWQAFDRLEPIGPERDDWRTALICATIANSVRDPKQRPQPFESQEFLLNFRRQPAPDEADEVAERGARIAAALRQAAQGVIGG